jgi:hypothetical protein
VDLGAHFEGKFYQGDRTNGVLHVVDTCTGVYLKSISGFAGCVNFNATSQACAEDQSGPNGNVLNPFRGHMWVGDGAGKLQIVDMYSNTIVKTIQTGLQSRADELAFDRRNNMIVSTFPGAQPPALLFFDADTFQAISYAFKLSAIVPSGSEFFTFVTVKGNGPPQGGVVVVSPDTGEEFTTQFSIVTSVWSADDEVKPLQYQFSFGFFEGEEKYYCRRRCRSISTHC